VPCLEIIEAGFRVSFFAGEIRRPGTATICPPGNLAITKWQMGIGLAVYSILGHFYSFRSDLILNVKISQAANVRD